MPVAVARVDSPTAMLTVPAPLAVAEALGPMAIAIDCPVELQLDDPIE